MLAHTNTHTQRETINLSAACYATVHTTANTRTHTLPHIKKKKNEMHILRDMISKSVDTPRHHFTPHTQGHTHTYSPFGLKTHSATYINAFTAPTLGQTFTLAPLLPQLSTLSPLS